MLLLMKNIEWKCFIVNSVLHTLRHSTVRMQTVKGHRLMMFLGSGILVAIVS